MNKEDLRVIFNNIDPIGIFFEDNIDEYDPEIDKFIESSNEASGPQDVYDSLMKIFIGFFDKQITNRSKKRIGDLASDLYKYKSGDKSVLNYTYIKDYNKIQHKIIKRLFNTPNWVIIFLLSVSVLVIISVTTLL